MARGLWSSDFPGIYIEDWKSPKGFVEAVRFDLNRLNALALGHDLLTLLSKRSQGIGTRAGKKVTILYINVEKGTLGGRPSLRELGRTAQSNATDGTMGVTDVRRPPPPGSVVRLPGAGDSSIVRYSPFDEVLYTKLVELRTPTHVALAHELLHALHVIGGESKPPDKSNPFYMYLEEEAFTVGLGIYANTRISENAIRTEVGGLPLRTFYSQPGDCDHFKSCIRPRPVRGTIGGAMNPDYENEFLHEWV